MWTLPNTGVAAAAAIASEMDTRRQMEGEERTLEKKLFKIWHASKSSEDECKLNKHQRRMKFASPLDKASLLTDLKKQEAEFEKDKEQILFCEWYDAWLAAMRIEYTAEWPGSRWPPFQNEACEKAWENLKRFQENGMSHAEAVFVIDKSVYEWHFKAWWAQYPHYDPVEAYRRTEAYRRVEAMDMYRWRGFKFC